MKVCGCDLNPHSPKRGDCAKRLKTFDFDGAEIKDTSTATTFA